MHVYVGGAVVCEYVWICVDMNVCVYDVHCTCKYVFGCVYVDMYV